MKKYSRWIVFGVVALGLLALMVLVGVNEKLRKRILSLLLERKVITAIKNLQDDATAAKAKADANEISAEEAEKEAKAIETAISDKKKILQEDLEGRGLNADEIASRFGDLGM